MKAKVIPISAAQAQGYNAAEEKENNVIGARISEARKKRGMTLADISATLEGLGVKVSRSAASKWETGETVPNTETLKLLSKLFDVSINTLLGSPRKLICQCCGMPLEDSVISRESDGTFNEDYCKWCYSDGSFAYPTKESLLDYLVGHMPNPDHTKDEDRRMQFDAYLSQLKHWK